MMYMHQILAAIIGLVVGGTVCGWIGYKAGIKAVHRGVANAKPAKQEAEKK